MIIRIFIILQLVFINISFSHEKESSNFFLKKTTFLAAAGLSAAGLLIAGSSWAAYSLAKKKDQGILNNHNPAPKEAASATTFNHEKMGDSDLLEEIKERGKNIKNDESPLRQKNSPVIITDLDKSQQAITTVQHEKNMAIRNRFMEFFNREKEQTSSQSDELTRKIQDVERERGFFDNLTDTQVNYIIDFMDNWSTKDLTRDEKRYRIESLGIKDVPTKGAINYPGDDFVRALHEARTL